MKKLLATSFSALLALQSPSYAYSIYTMAIDDYSLNGTNCASPASSDFPFDWAKGDAQATGNKASSKGWTWQWHDTDTNCYNGSFYAPGAGNLPYVSQVDMFYFAGHSSENGPHLGYGYNRDYDSSCNLVMKPSNYYKWSHYVNGATSGNSKLKWFLNRACLMLFYSSDPDPFGTGTWALNRYYKAFDEAGSQYPKGSLHTLFGSVADTYLGPYSVGNDFFDRTMATSGAQNAGPAWVDAMYWQAYRNPGTLSAFWFAKGIKIGLLTTYVYSGSTVYRNYYNESMKTPYSDPSDQWYNTPYYTGLYFYKHEEGTPKYHDQIIP
jgi:Family of unknown function (DUF6345)